MASVFVYLHAYLTVSDIGVITRNGSQNTTQHLFSFIAHLKEGVGRECPQHISHDFSQLAHTQRGCMGRILTRQPTNNIITTTSLDAMQRVLNLSKSSILTRSWQEVTSGGVLVSSKDFHSCSLRGPHGGGAFVNIASALSYENNTTQQHKSDHIKANSTHCSDVHVEFEACDISQPEIITHIQIRPHMLRQVLQLHHSLHLHPPDTPH
jgi:hypothetical protein